jgi:hypothetical protein
LESLVRGYVSKEVRAVLLSAAVLLAVALASAAHASRSYVYDEELGVVARESLSRSVQPTPSRSQVSRVGVRCYRDKRSFEQVFEARFGLSATRVIAYYAGGSDVHLRDTTCANVREFLVGRHTVYTAAAYAILLHEALHRQGVRNERVTSCLASDAVRWGAMWLGFDEQRALRARNLSLTFTRLLSPPDYRMGKPNCLLLNRRTDWVDHRVRPAT